MFSLHTINHIIIDNHIGCIYIYRYTHTGICSRAKFVICNRVKLQCVIRYYKHTQCSPIDKFSSTTSECVYMKCQCQLQSTVHKFPIISIRVCAHNVFWRVFLARLSRLKRPKIRPQNACIDFNRKNACLCTRCIFYGSVF